MVSAPDPARPWRVGEQLSFSTCDVEDADLRDLDGTVATVLEVADGFVRVTSDYGTRWCDPYDFVVEADRG